MILTHRFRKELRLFKKWTNDSIIGDMAKLSKSDVLHVAKLANLNLTEKEIDKFAPQLSKVVDFVGELSKVDTNNVEPTSQTTGLSNITRIDNVNLAGSLTEDEALSGSDKVYNGYFKVNAILKERSDK